MIFRPAVRPNLNCPINCTGVFATTATRRMIGQQFPAAATEQRKDPVGWN